MYEFLDLIRRLPRPLKYLAAVFVLIPIIYVFSRMLGVEKYWWVFVLGLLVIAIILSLFDGLVKRRERGKASAFEGELKQDAQKGAASREEVRQALGDLAAKWSEAVVQLRQAGLDIYSLPWYLLIGEPQSGKSTTLKNSGLEFPVGADALSGAGGTRNCDWWFANEAVILDTAGRFTFQEDSAPDQAEWGSFLRLLYRHRKFCPINGVLVVIPSTSLLEDSPEEQERKAQNIRQKLLNVQRVLQIRFPVFVMVTKSDRILGFSEYFVKLDPVDQQQLFGWSNPEGPAKPYNPEGFDAIYDEIVVRLYKLRLKFLADEENPASSDKMYVFPEEFRELKTPLSRYFKTIFLQTRFDEPFAFRGFYFSSGVQQGRPIAQATRDLLETPGGASAGVLENLENIFKKSRAFFIRHFYEKKVFPEQGLIARTAAAEAKSRKTLWLVRILGILIVLLFLGGMVPAYRSLQRVLNPIRRSVREARECVAKGNCSVAESWRISSDIQHEREALSHKGWTFALFLRGSRSNELVTTLGAIQRKIYLSGVVAPLLGETEARMASLDWAAYKDYRPFFDALKTELDWVAAKKPPASGTIVRFEDLRVLPLIGLSRGTRGMHATPRSQEIDDWLKSPDPSPTDARPDEILTEALHGAEAVAIPVPDPDRPITTFERFWTVENLARWDFTLQDGLARYVDLYGQMTSLPKSAPPQYLAQFVDVGSKFQANYDATTKHMASPRPGEKGFPGATLDQWKTALRQDYQTLLKWKPVAPGRIGEPRREELLAKMDGDYATLVARQSGLTYLLDAAAPKPTWSKPAASLAGTLSDLTNYSNLNAYAATDDGKLLDKLSAMTAWSEKPKAVDEWRSRQEQPEKTILTKAAEMSAANPDPKFLWNDRRPVVEQTAALALVWRTLPTAQTFFGDALVAKCPPNICYTPEFARAMVSSASLVVGFGAKQQAVAAFDGVAPAIQALAGSEKTYLESYIDRMGGGGGGGGGGFIFPNAAAGAGSWSAFQRAIATWTPTGGGGGGAPVDTGGQLSLADVQAFVNANEKLAEVLEYYKSRVERPRAAAAGATVSPDLLAAAEQFRTAVSALAGEPLKAWKQLANAEGGVSLKQYKAFSENPRVRSIPLAVRMRNEVEFRGAHLMRDQIRPAYLQREPVPWGRLSGCCLSKFPFINEVQLRVEQQQFSAGSGYTRSGGTMRIELPTISAADISGPLADVGQLSAEFALDPIFAGEAREFDFVGEHRPILAVARGWERFLFGTPGVPGQAGGVPREHKIEIRSVERPLAPGAVFIGDRVGLVMLFDGSERLRPSTDIKTGRTPPPFTWRLNAADAPLTILGQNEDARGGWKGTLDITGGPLKLFYYVRRASEDRRPIQDDKVWDIRVEIPDAERSSTRLQGAFELRFDEPLPGVIPR
jgi:hypothetical protein